MEATIDIEFLQGDNEQIIKEAVVVSDDVVQTYVFRPPCYMEPHGSEENGLSWADGHFPYDQVKTVLREAVAPYDHLYARGFDKCELLTDILNRPKHNYEDLECPDPMKLNSEVHCTLPCHTFSHTRYAARNANALHSWLLFHFKHKSFIECPSNHGRHTVQFASGVPKPNTFVTKP